MRFFTCVYVGERCGVITWAVSRKGNPQLLLEGYSYSLRKRKKNGHEFWRCGPNKLCTAHLDKCDDVVRIIAPHCHPPSNPRLIT